VRHRTVHHRAGLALLVVASVLFAACRGDRNESGADSLSALKRPDASRLSPVRKSGVPDSAAMSRLALYLKSALITNAVNREDTLYTCVPDELPERHLALATFRVLGAASSGDSALASAEVTSVAEESLDTVAAISYVTTVRTRVDTLQWEMTRSVKNGQWGVCGFSRNGADFRIYGTDRQTRWIPPGNSWAAVKITAQKLQRQSR